MRRRTLAERFRLRLVGVLILLDVAFVLLVTLWPTTVDRPIDPALLRFLAALHRHGVPMFVNYDFVESSANVLFFVPVGFLANLLLPYRRMWFAALLGALLSCGVETAQWLFLPGRVASLQDVLHNTIGAVLGCAVAVLFRRVIRHRDTLVIRDALAGRTGTDALPVTVPPAPERGAPLS
jgi:glycopeptide antibiotics resistance protein